MNVCVSEEEMQGCVSVLMNVCVLCVASLTVYPINIIFPGLVFFVCLCCLSLHVACRQCVDII